MARGFIAGFAMLLVTSTSWAQQPADLATLRAALVDGTPEGREGFVRDLINGRYRDLPAAEVVPLLAPLIKVPLEEDLRLKTSQGLIMRHLSHAYGPQAADVMPDLLTHIVNFSLDSYLRASAIDAAAGIAPGDAKLIRALIEAIESDQPRSTSQVHDRAAYVLGRMGEAAYPARPALRQLLNHHFRMVRDHAFTALGQLADHERPITTVDAALQHISGWRDATPDELAAALLYVRGWSTKKQAAARATQEAAHLGKLAKQHPSSPKHARRAKAASAAAHAAQAAAIIPQRKAMREALRQLIDATENDHQQRAAIAALMAIDSGSEPEMVATLLKAMLKDHSSQAERALKQLDGRHPQSVPLLIDALQTTLRHAHATNAAGERTDHQWHQPVVIAHALARFGPHAEAATPLLTAEIRVMNDWTSPSGADRHQVEAYVKTLGAIGKPSDDAIRAVLGVLDQPPPPITTGGVRWQSRLQPHAIEALGKMGLSDDDALRREVLNAVRAELARPHAADAAITFLTSIAARLSEQEAAAWVEPLIQLVRADDSGNQEDSGNLEDSGEERVQRGSRQITAVRALQSIGSTAHKALPLLRSIAVRPLPEPGYDWRSWQEGELIRTARKAAEAIAADR